MIHQLEAEIHRSNGYLSAINKHIAEEMSSHGYRPMKPEDVNANIEIAFILDKGVEYTTIKEVIDPNLAYKGFFTNNGDRRGFENTFVKC